MNNYYLSLPIILTFALTTPLQAKPTSAVVSAQASVVFGKTKSASIKLVPLGPFTQAVPTGTKVLIGEATSTDARVAYRWSSGQAHINISQARRQIASIRGAGGGVTTFRLEADTPGGAAIPIPDGWIVSVNNPAKFHIVTASQDIAADTYSVVIEAVAWGA